MFPSLFLPSWLIVPAPDIASCPQRRALISSGDGSERVPAGTGAQSH